MRPSYSMCWEDSAILTNALRPTHHDRILTIASGGENVFALLLHSPERLVAIDADIGQLMIIRLKIAAIKALPFDAFIRFLGYLPCNDRLLLYQKLVPLLSQKEQLYWDRRPGSIRSGVIHMGRFERYLSFFRRFGLPVILGRKAIRAMLACRSVTEQQVIFRKSWDSARWRLGFSLFFSSLVLKHAARASAQYAHLASEGHSNVFRSRFERMLCTVPVKGNWFLAFILTGSLSPPLIGHPYLDPAAFSVAREKARQIEVVHDDIISFCSRQKPGSFTLFNCSDIFEGMSQQEYENSLQVIAGAIARGGRLCYWNNLVPRNSHPLFSGFTPIKRGMPKVQDRTGFYGSFHVESRSA